MRIAPLLRRLGPALLAALVLVASVAGAAHRHARVSEQAAVAAAPSAGEKATSADLVCALCASAARPGHGAVAATFALVEPSSGRFAAPDLAGARPPRVDLALAGARAPPRHG